MDPANMLLMTTSADTADDPQNAVIDPTNFWDINTYACCKEGALTRDNDLLLACLGKQAGYVWDDSSSTCFEVARNANP